MALPTAPSLILKRCLLMWHTLELGNPASQLARAALDTLHGARGLPPAEATAKLHDFLEFIDTSVPDGPRFADASEALRILGASWRRKGQRLMMICLLYTSDAAD